MQAKGEFEVKRIPQDELEIGEGATVGHSRFDKRFHGPLDATSVVHMLALMSPVQGSGAYVAMERIVGTLDGRRGSFHAQHSGIMDRGKPSLDLTVVPELSGEVAATVGTLVTEGKAAALERVAVRAQLPWLEIDALEPLTLNLDGEPVESRHFRIDCVPKRVRMKNRTSTTGAL